MVGVVQASAGRSHRQPVPRAPSAAETAPRLAAPMNPLRAKVAITTLLRAWVLVAAPMVAVAWILLANHPRQIFRDLDASTPTIPPAFWLAIGVAVLGSFVAVFGLVRTYRRLSGRMADAGWPSLIVLSMWCVVTYGVEGRWRVCRAGRGRGAVRVVRWWAGLSRRCIRRGWCRDRARRRRRRRVGWRAEK
jgi:hypothetical protein